MRNLIQKIRDLWRGVPTLGGRSSQWPKIRAEHLRTHPKCELCGGTKKLEVHHIRPFHLFPQDETSKDNLITLCEGNKSVVCHRFFGHLGNYKNFNSSVRVDVKKWNVKLSLWKK